MKRNNKEISGNSGGGDRQPAQNGIQGSTIIAVLAAMLFIGIVTASMVKNTGSQSAASIGYSTMQTMSSTTRSGMIATESWFGRAGGDSAGTVGVIINWLNANSAGVAGNEQLVRFGNTKTRQDLGNKQFFSSSLVNVSPPDMNAKYLTFEVKSGRTENGKALKKARAFYSTDTTLKITVTNDLGAQNAYYSKGPAKNFDDGFDIRGGPATFEDEVHQNAQKPLIFHDNVYFGKYATFNGKATFNDVVYFHEDVKIQNEPVTFNSKAGFNGNFAAAGQGSVPVTFGGDVWLNGNFNKEGTGNDIGQYPVLQSNNTNNNIYYSGNIPMAGSATGCGGDSPTKCTSANATVCSANPTNSNCCVHKCSHVSNLKSQKILGFGNRDNASAYQSGMTAAQIRGGIGMTSLEERRDPQISMYNIPEGIIKNANDIKDGSGNLDVNKLTALYNTANSQGDVYNGHLVVKIPGPGGLTCNEATNAATFGGKVIFIVEDGASFNVNSNFYKSGKDASTLVYAGPDNASLVNFGTDGLFRGYIYIDSANTSNNHTFKWGNNAEIVGAIHNQSKMSIQGNNNNLTTTPIVRFDKDVLNQFACLRKGVDCAVGGNFSGGYAHPDSLHLRKVGIKSMGFYFY